MLYFLLTPKENKYSFPVEILMNWKNNGGMNRKENKFHQVDVDFTSLWTVSRN